jgi:hypothetical protein
VHGQVLYGLREHEFACIHRLTAPCRDAKLKRGAWSVGSSSR